MNSAVSPTRPTCVLVLGMHRSGTSALTRCLNLVGMDLGSHLLSPEKMNAKGFWEHADAVRINDELLAALGLLWHSLDPLPDGWLTSEAADVARSEIRIVVQRDFEGVPLWGIKDPRMCRLAPLWIEVLHEMGIDVVSVFMVRSPLEVAESLHRAHRLSVPHGVMLWAQHLDESVLGARSIPRVMVDYEHLLADPVVVLSKIGRELELAWPIAPVERRDAILAFLDVGLRTHRKSVSKELVPPLVLELIEVCASIVDNPSPTKWLCLAEMSARVMEQLQTLSYLGIANGFKDRGAALMRAELAGWVPNMALYFATDENPEYSEERCLLMAVPWGRNQRDLALPANAGSPVRLRFDPLDRRGAFVLHSFVLFDRLGQVVWDLASAEDGVALVGIDQTPGLVRAGHLVAYTNEDPQINIELPRDVVERQVVMARVDIECLDVGALTDEIATHVVRAKPDGALLMGKEELLRSMVDAFANEYQRQAEAYAEEHRRQAEVYAEEHRRQADFYAEDCRRQSERHAEEYRLLLEANANERRQVEALAEEFRLERLAHEQALAAERGGSQLKINQLTEQLRISTESSRREMDRLMAIQLMQAHELQTIHASTGWRVVLRLRRVSSRVPVRVRGGLRRVIKAAWWCVTPWRLPARLRFLRDRKAAQARQSQPPTPRGSQALQQEAPPAPVIRPTAISFIPVTDGALGAAGGYYQLGRGERRYTYIPPRPPVNLQEELAAMSPAPRLSIVVPVYNTPVGLLEKLVDSVLAQWYPHWELVLVNDNSSLEHIRAYLDQLNDQRIVVVHLAENKRIALATNEGIARASGEYIVFTDHDDELTPDCLYELARSVERENPDFIYSDEDKIDEGGQYVQPFFKPAWSPDTMISTMYTCHVSCVRRALVNEVGGLRPEYDGCQDWDLILRVVEKTDRIAHVPKVLYHWRIIPASVASGLDAKPHVIATSKRVREEALARRGFGGVMEPLPEIPGYFRAVYPLRGEPCISIIISSKGNHRALKRCIDSIESKSRYRNFEIVIVDHESTDSATTQYIEKLRVNVRIKTVTYDKPFNVAAVNNFGAQASRGEILVFLNECVEVIEPEWLERLGGYAQLPHMGAVGAKLLYPGGETVQQVGIVNLSGGPGYGFSGLAVQEHGYFARAVLEYNWLAVSGACLMIERSKFDRVTGFDEDFQGSCHDVEFCFRLVEEGYFNLSSPAVKLVVHGPYGLGSGDASSARRAEFGPGTQLLYQKHPQFYEYDPFYSPNLAPDDVRFGLPR